MIQNLQAAAEFLRDIGVKNVGIQKPDDKMFGVIRGTNSGGNVIIVRVQIKSEWGQDLSIKNGNWNQPRYPFGSVQFCLPKPGDSITNYTHYLLMGSDLKRAVLTPVVNIEAAPRAWMRIDGPKEGEMVMVQTAAVENFTPKLVFFSKSASGWAKDPNNVWVKPKPIPQSADEFLNSL